LGVELLLAGAIVEAGSRVRMTITLSDPSDRIVYSDELTLAPSDILSGQAAIVSSVARHLAVSVSADEQRVLAVPALEASAQDAFLRGLVEMESGLDTSLPIAAEHFHVTTELAPGFAPAWAGLAMVDLRLAEFADAARRFERVERAKQYADRALAIDRQSPAGLLALGTAQFYYDWDFEGAERTLRLALESKPSDAATLGRLALLLAALGRLDEAVELGARVVRLEPLVPRHLTTLGLLHYYRRDYARASEMMHQSLRIAPENPVARFGQGLIYSARGEYDLAADHIRRALDHSPNMAWLPELACVLAAGDQSSAKESVLLELSRREREGETYSVDHRAHMAAAEGRLDEGFEYLRQAVEQKVPGVLWMQVDPRLDPFRADPRFDQLVQHAQLRR
jgi:tetratricopeptide (TPR) repeat protein